jgi:glycosyltransferase involved in cell wall biosynthesis
MSRFPLVSCIMPTRDRHELVPQAVACFLAQQYPHRELVVVDDGLEPVGDRLPRDPRIRYVRLDDPPASTGAKRNLACGLARGDLIAHWDDDDWCAPWRLTYQVDALLAHDVDVCGLVAAYFWDRAQKRAWRFAYPHSMVSVRLIGGTLCYRRSAWQRAPFRDLRVGEDTHFVARFPARRMLGLDDARCYVASVHAGNTSRKRTQSPLYQPCEYEAVERLVAGGASPLPESNGED